MIELAEFEIMLLLILQTNYFICLKAESGDIEIERKMGHIRTGL